VIRSGSSSNTPLGVTTTTTENEPESCSAIDRTTTPFCLGCGAWVEKPEELDVSPWYYCEWCTPKKATRIKVREKGRK
jgi:hypothetical protein